MRPVVALALALVGTQAVAAGLVSGPPSTDLSKYATKDAVPKPCGVAPSPDTLMGTPGSADCYTPRDATRPTVVQATSTSTVGSGTWSVTWSKSFGQSPVVLPIPVNTGALPIACNVATVSTSSATGRCWQSFSTTLPGSINSVLGIVVSPFTAPAVGVPVMVIAREPTQ